MKRDLTKIVIKAKYSIRRRKKYSTNKITYNHINVIWSIDLADMID